MLCHEYNYDLKNKNDFIWKYLAQAYKKFSRRASKMNFYLYYLNTP